MASPQARQKKMERKRLKREEKRRALRLAGELSQPGRMVPKMSDSLEELIQPLLDLIEPEERSVPILQKALKLGMLAWNLSVAHQGAELEEELDRISQSAADTTIPADFRDCMKLLVERKCALFPDDRRLIADTVAYQNENGFQIMAASISCADQRPVPPRRAPATRAVGYKPSPVATMTAGEDSERSPPGRPEGAWSHRALLAPSARYLALGVMVASFFFPVEGLGFDICLLHRLTGWPCPGCGMTRAISAISQGDLVAALGLNPFSLLAWPVFLVLAVATLLPRRQFKAFAAWAEARSGLVGKVYRSCVLAFLGFGLGRLAVFMALGLRFP